MRQVVPIQQQASRVGQKLAVTAEVVEGHLITGFTHVPAFRASTIDTGLRGGGVKLVTVPPRDSVIPQIEFQDGMYPRVASACRVASSIVDITVGLGRANWAITPMGTRQGQNKLVMTGAQESELVVVGGFQHVILPGELALAGMVASYNAMELTGAMQVGSFTVPQGGTVELG